MATYSSILAWRIPWTDKHGRLQSMGSQELDMTATEPPPSPLDTMSIVFNLTLISILDSVHTACGKGPKWFVKTGSELLWVLRLLLLLSCSVLSDSLWLDGLQPARLPWSSLAQRVCSNSCPLSQWCHLTISSSATPFSFCLQSFPASRSFPMTWLFD